MAVIVVSILDVDTKSAVEEFCKMNSYQFISVKINKFTESLKGKSPDIYVLEIHEINSDISKNLKQIKKDPVFQKMSIFAYLDSMDVKTEITLRKFKIDTFFVRRREKRECIDDLIHGLGKHFEIKEIQKRKIEESKKPFDDSLLSESTKIEQQTTNVKELATQFSSLVSKEVGEGDIENHYNLGQSYMDMGLYDNAIESFTLTAKSAEKFHASCYNLGICYYKQGKKNKAISTLFHGFKSSGKKKEGAGLGYELGNILCEAGRKKDALKIYQMVGKVDADFADVRDKIEKLKKELA